MMRVKRAVLSVLVLLSYPARECPARDDAYRFTIAPETRRDVAAVIMAVGTVGGASINTFTDHPRGGFHRADEQWFGEHTYVGGADKVSHFVSFEILARGLAELYEYLGYSPPVARAAGFGVSVAAGTIIEIGDGTNQYGFSYEDLVMDVLGAATAVLLSAADLEDLIGFRAGRVPGPAPAKTVEGLGRDYSHEIYTADLKLAGLAQRLRVNPGPARFLLISATYGVKGYPYGAPQERERQLGFELGLNLTEMLDAARVPRDRLWGLVAHLLSDAFRIPYTAGGFRYDLNHHRWGRPDTGERCHACR